MADLKHRDWLLFSTKSLILSVDQNISVKIIDTPNGGKLLIASGISETAIDKLHFIVNTDQNNNYLYLEDFKVYKKNSPKPLNIPGLKDIMINVFRSSDAFNFVSDNKTHIPFSGSNFKTASVDTFSQYIDKLSSFLPHTLSTNGSEKTYEIVLNPDSILNAMRNALDPNRNGLAESARNTGRVISSWNAMGSHGPAPITAGLHLLQTAFKMGGVKIGGNPNLPASAAVPTIGGMSRLARRSW
jgi:hypothetical protein